MIFGAARKKKKSLSFMEMKCYKSLFSFCLAVTILAAACTKGVEPQDIHAIDYNDTTLPIVVINNPSNNQSFKSGDIIHVSGKVTDNSLFQGSIRFTDDASGSIMKEQQYEIHGLQEYNFDLPYPASVLVVSNYTVTVQYEDHGLNITTQSVKIKINP
jgi:hypothetical protein